MQKGRSAAQVAEDEKRFFDGMVFVSGEEDVIERKAEPVYQSANGPDEIEKGEENDSFAGEAGCGVF